MRTLLITLSLFIFQLTGAQTNWQKIQSVEEVCQAYPDQINSLFQHINLDYPGLQEVKKAYESNNIPQACKSLLKYYSTSNRIRKDLPAASTQTTTQADSILHDIYTFQTVAGQVPRLGDGHLKWAHNGPEDDIEWAWALNRHYPVRDLVNDYLKTGNPEYVRYIDMFIKDWITSSWPYPAKKSNTAMWRGLEVSFRVKTWATVFFDLWNTNLISPATRLLLLSSLPDHAHYARNFHAQGNWLTMEISGLATVASSWPEFKESKAWMDYAIQTMVASMKDQVYPDGVQTELTSSYHYVALSNFNLFAEICRKNNVPLPDYYSRTLEDMWNYLAKTMRPDGFGLLNNDADLLDNRAIVIEAAKTYKRADWTYIATNGKEGVKPNTQPSCVFPYAGQLISRSDFGPDAQWSFFDIGPWGSGHQHNDKLHISVFAYGHDLLVDGGRFAYRGEVAKKFRNYATGSYGHNVILVDGQGQADGPKVAEKEIGKTLYDIKPGFDYGSGTFDKFNNTEGQFIHTRSVVYVRGKFWVVADQVKTDRPRNIEVLWHWHPSNQVQVLKSGVVSTQNKRGNLKIIPVGRSSEWKINQVKGQETPSVQAWYSPVYNTFEPNPTTIYSKRVRVDETLVWVLWPSEGKAPQVQTQILSQDEHSVLVRITETGKESWVVRIPYMDSKTVEVQKK